MVSQGSHCDSETGLPGYMQDSYDSDGLEEVKSRREVEDYPILVGHNGGERTKPSSSGGIRVARN